MFLPLLMRDVGNNDKIYCSNNKNNESKPHIDKRKENLHTAYSQENEFDAP